MDIIKHLGLEETLQKIYDIHDIDNRQVYGDILPYSQHLKWVVQKTLDFVELYPVMGGIEEDLKVVIIAAAGHDLLEDTNMTFNDLYKFLLNECSLTESEAFGTVDVIYRLTDEKGRNREERKNDKYYNELRGSSRAVYVKLADIAVNTLFSKLQGGTMYDKYKKEFPKFKEKTYNPTLKPIYDYIENL